MVRMAPVLRPGPSSKVSATVFAVPGAYRWTPYDAAGQLAGDATPVAGAVRGVLRPGIAATGWADGRTGGGADWHPAAAAIRVRPAVRTTERARPALVRQVIDMCCLQEISCRLFPVFCAGGVSVTTISAQKTCGERR